MAEGEYRAKKNYSQGQEFFLLAGTLLRKFLVMPLVELIQFLLKNVHIYLPKTDPIY